MTNCLYTREELIELFKPPPVNRDCLGEGSIRKLPSGKYRASTASNEFSQICETREAAEKWLKWFIEGRGLPMRRCHVSDF